MFYTVTFHPLQPFLRISLSDPELMAGNSQISSSRLMDNNSIVRMLYWTESSTRRIWTTLSVGINSHDHMYCSCSCWGGVDRGASLPYCTTILCTVNKPLLKLVYCIVAQVPPVSVLPISHGQFHRLWDWHEAGLYISSADHLDDVWHLEVGRIAGA